MARIARFTVLGLLFTAAACGGGSGSDGGADATDDESSVEAPIVTRPKPTAPAGTAAPAATTTDLLDLLPKAGDIGSLELGIPAVAAIRIMAVEVTPDPTGPCGAALTLPPLEGGAGRTYDSVQGRITGVILPPSPEVDAYVAANSADLTEGCPPHTTTLADGTEITLSTPEAVDISATNPDGVAWIATVEGPEPATRATVMLPTPEGTVIVWANSIEPIDAAFVQTVADVWQSKATG
jgi:hypothetical protein